MKYKIIAGLLAIIVIMLTPAYAAQLDVTRYSGVDEINGYARSNDQIIIKATAEMYGSPTTEVAARRLKVHHSGISERFQTCSTFGATTYKCSYTTSGVYSGTQTFKIDLLDADGAVVETIDKIITVDYLSPSIIEFDVNPKRGKDNTITINYKAEDYAVGTGDTSTCSGIKEVAFFVNNQKVAAEAGQRELCSKENTIDYTRQVTNYEKITLCAKTIDMLEQQSSSVCKEYEIDRHAPEIKSVHIKDADGFDITGIRSGTDIVGSVEAIIEGDNDDVDVVMADLSSLNPSLTGEKAPDEILGTSYVWRDVQIVDPSSCQITIRAIDNLGNEATTTETCSLPVDDSGPEAVKIETNYTDEDGTLLIGNKGTIKLEIREAGAGLFRKHVYMDLSMLGRTYSTQQRADECHIKTGDVWECTWIVEPKVPDGDYKIKLSPATRDDLDNGVASAIEKPIRVDRVAPIIEDIKFSVDHAFAEYGDLVVKGDIVEFKIKTKETEYAYANFTGLGGGYTPGTCTGEETITCTFSQTILQSGPDNATVEFEFFDRAGNKETYSHDIVIYGLSDDLSPEYWNSTVECSPKLIDRSTTTLKEQLVYCHIHLATTNDDVEPIHTSIDETLTECTGMKQGIAEIEMVNNGYKSRDPYMKITLALSEFNINNMSFSCPVHISSKVGDFFSKTDEKEFIDINLEFYDLPMGELYENIEKDIDWEMEKAMNYMSWVDDVEKYTEIARKLCQWKTAATGLLSALDAVLGAVVVPITVLTATGNKEKAEKIEKMRQTMCNNVKGPLEKELFEKKGKESKKTAFEKAIGPKTAGTIQSMWTWLDMFCDFLNCRLTWDDERYKQLREAGIAGKLAGGFLVGGGGGGTPQVCKSVENFLSGTAGLGKETYQKYTKLQSSLKQPGDATPRLTNVKESLFWSTVCHCGPGIIYNLNKIRQISCKYALCLAEDVKTQGIDPSWCRAEKAYLTCTYVIGEIFSILPIITFYDEVINTVKEWFENPLSIIDAVSGCLCGGCADFGINPFCDPKNKKLTPAQQAGGYIICILPKTFAKVMDAIISIKSMPAANSKEFEVGNSYCQQAKSKGLDKKYG